MSTIVTVNEQLGPTVGVQVTVVTPFGKLLPDDGEQLTVSHIPVVVGLEYVTVLAQVPGATLSWMFDGHVIRQHSTAVTDFMQVLLQLFPSVTVRDSVNEPGLLFTLTDCEVVEPEIVPLPLIAQL